MVEGAKQAAAFLYGSSEERSLKFAESNAGLLAMSIMIAAKELGVDSHPMSGIDFDGIHKAFNLQPDETVVMTIALGYVDQSKTLYPKRPRRGFNDITTVE
jgi:nitroreductase